MKSIEWLSCVERGCGIGQYSELIAQKLLSKDIKVQLHRKGNPNEYTLAFPHRSLRNLRNYVAPFYLKKHLDHLGTKSDVFHADNIDAFTALIYSNKAKGHRNFVTIHDVIPIACAHLNWFQDKYYRFQLKQSIEKSDIIFTVSHFSKKDIIKHTGVPEKKVKVVYNGINHNDLYPNKNNKENKIFTIRYIGGLGVAHKNATALIEVARILENENVPFIMEIGSGKADLTTLPALVEKYNIKSVKFSGFIPDGEKRSFLADADCFLFPSLYEGFGFPPLEAMACGTAVVSSNCASLPEVLGDAALFSDPNPELMAQNVIKIYKSKTLKEDLEKRGIEQAKKFTWENTVNELLNHYQS
ncbi:glycosyltransferase family 4 protein [Flammeovirga sp. MY04]|uniref:glycosyltransferase family 4 protein n=1 Tax=Flammeovirga sp. MY04 TaxID=1191459 RepID=UPI000806092C|nr:glycosyltransferase family 1 protein [Flammeovirga sp. MY04]ANQ52084.1 glycosyltransferase family 4 protein [Flammeovirga sp. MY04]